MDDTGCLGFHLYARTRVYERLAPSSYNIPTASKNGQSAKICIISITFELATVAFQTKMDFMKLFTERVIITTTKV